MADSMRKLFDHKEMIDDVIGTGEAKDVQKKTKFGLFLIELSSENG